MRLFRILRGAWVRTRISNAIASSEGSYVSMTVRLARTPNALKSVVRLIGRAYSNCVRTTSPLIRGSFAVGPSEEAAFSEMVTSASAVAVTPSAGVRWIPRALTCASPTPSKSCFNGTAPRIETVPPANFASALAIRSSSALARRSTFNSDTTLGSPLTCSSPPATRTSPFTAGARIFPVE